MNNNSKRLLALVPILLLTSVASTSYLDNASIVSGCQDAINSGQSSTSCRLVVNSLSWYDWLAGSSSSQFHFIDLLELITSSDS